MAKVIVFATNSSGKAAVCYPTGEIPVEEVVRKDCPPDAFIIEDTELPQNADDYFDAWVVRGGKVEVSIDAAKEVHKNKLRAARVAKLEALDRQFMKNLEKNKDNTAVIEAKEALRDVTDAPEIVAANTLDELKAFWPDFLK